LARKASSRTTCPCTAHPASRISLADRVTLSHDARQIETQKKKKHSPHTTVPPPYPNPCPSLLTLPTSPKMTANHTPSRPSPLLSHIRSGAQKPCRCAVFLIANPRLKVQPSPSKLSALKFPNRERMAIHRRAFWLLSSFTPQPASLQNSWPPYDRRLIANLELNLRLTGRKTNHIQISNRKFSAVFAENSSISTANSLFLHSGSSNLRWRD
jgi:hypothetical protein